MDKKYQVFISSTYADLIDERKKVLDILLMADCIPAGMEAFVATDVEQFEVIKKVIDLCDYYVLIIGKRYGSIHPDTGISYTEMEYDYAINQGIPVLVFALDESVDLPEDKKETDPEKNDKLRVFRDKAMTNRLASIWKSADELTGKLAVSIMKAKAEISRPGWQRGADYDEASLRRDIMSLQEENKRLSEELSKKEKLLVEMTSQSNLAFENYQIEIPYYYTWSNGRTSSIEHSKLKTDLKTIFLVIATEMMDVAISEAIIKDAIMRGLPFSQYTPHITDSQFIKRMLNQYRALSLIESRYSKNNILLWQLTSKGEKVRDDSILLKQ